MDSLSINCPPSKAKGEQSPSVLDSMAPRVLNKAPCISINEGVVGAVVAPSFPDLPTKISPKDLETVSHSSSGSVAGPIVAREPIGVAPLKIAQRDEEATRPHPFTCTRRNAVNSLHTRPSTHRATCNSPIPIAHGAPETMEERTGTNRNGKNRQNSVLLPKCNLSPQWRRVSTRADSAAVSTPLKSDADDSLMPHDGLSCATGSLTPESKGGHSLPFLPRSLLFPSPPQRGGDTGVSLIGLAVQFMAQQHCSLSDEDSDDEEFVLVTPAALASSTSYRKLRRRCCSTHDDENGTSGTPTPLVSQRFSKAASRQGRVQRHSFVRACGRRPLAPSKTTDECKSAVVRSLESIPEEQDNLLEAWVMISGES
jgi:hypothetical protein